MTVASTVNRASQAGNGVTTSFPFNAPYRASSDLVVMTRVTATGVESLKVENVDYTVVGVANAGTGGFDSASVNFGVAPATGVTVVINRVVPLTSSYDPAPNGGDSAATREGVIDRLTLALQGLREMIGRSLLLPKTSPLSDLALPEPSAATALLSLRVNAAGTGFEAASLTGATGATGATGPQGPAGTSAAAPSPPQGRLTLTSGAPVLTSDVTGATTIFYAPYVGAYVPLYNGASIDMTGFAELSQTLADSTKSPAATVANSNYDLFVWNDSGTMRCTRGPAWTSDTARGAGAGTTELQLVSGYYLNKVAITNGPAANRGTYVGTIRTNAANQVDFMQNPAGASGGSANKLHVWNAYNRKRVTARNSDSAVSWNYGTATWRVKNNNANNGISFVIGLIEDQILADNIGVAQNTSTSVQHSVAIGLDSVTVVSGDCVRGGGALGAAGNQTARLSTYNGYPGLGFHTLSPLEQGDGTGTLTWYGLSAEYRQSAFYVHAFM